MCFILTIKIIMLNFFRHLIHTKMSELLVTELPIVFPLNMTYVPLHEIKQPPWITI